jgi:hypothetical protein
VTEFFDRFAVTLDKLVLWEVPPYSILDTPLGQGRLNYVRLAPPEYRFIEAVSVKLASRVGDVTYNGTILPADQVRLVRPEGV